MPASVLSTYLETLNKKQTELRAITATLETQVSKQLALEVADAIEYDIQVKVLHSLESHVIDLAAENLSAGCTFEDFLAEVDRLYSEAE